ncbi:porin family protein [Arsenicitalea aurantiaca]|uniref:Porin family protein n=2 Tax=Arsenicitalea aurantiaca TaxID=1783274 RepID=A0A433XBM0_9HYPH|nr:porin family protein [Arsenicitalea aurantiaca]
MLSAALVTGLLGTAAQAADFGVYPAPVEPVYVPQSYDWTGFYVGINGGYGGGVMEHPYLVYGEDEPTPALAPLSVGTIPDAPPGTIGIIGGSADVTSGGFVGGAQIGYNHQWDQFVLGIEADIQGSTIDGRVSADAEFLEDFLLPEGSALSFDAGSRLDWFATLRPRLGYAHDRFMVYVTGGLAWGQVTSSINGEFSIGEDDSESEPFSVSETTQRIGWTVGGGIEYALLDNVTFKTEYLYTNLGQEELFNLELGEFGLVMDSAVSFHTVRAGLNFRF